MADNSSVDSAELEEYRKNDDYRPMYDNEQLVNGIRFNFAASYGIYDNVINTPINFIGEDTVQYVCGQYLVKYDINYNVQTWEKEQHYQGKITVLNYVKRKDDDSLLVVGEKLPGQKPTVSVSNSKKNCILPHQHLISKESYIEQVIFSRDQKKRNVCVTIARDAPDTCISVWLFSNIIKLVASKEIKQNIRKIAINPKAPTEQLIVCGRNYFKFWDIKQNEKSLEESSQVAVTKQHERENNFIDMDFVVQQSHRPSTLVAISDSNKIFIFKDGQLRHELDAQLSAGEAEDSIELSMEHNSNGSQAMSEESQHDIVLQCLTVTNKGFYIGCSYGHISLYAFEQDDLPPSHFANIKVPAIVDRVVGLSVSSDEIHIAAAVTLFDESRQFDFEKPVDNEHMPFKPEKMDFFIVNLNKVDGKGSNPIKRLFQAGSHFGAVRDVAVSTEKTLAVSIGADRFARIWSYGDKFLGVHAHKFPDMPLSVDIHPQGFQLLVGFKEFLRVYYITQDDFKLGMEQACKNCNCVKYSHSGEFFAASFGPVANLYSTYSLKFIQGVNNHLGQIRTLSWSRNDTVLTSADIQGTIYGYNILHDKQEYEYQDRKVKYSSVYYDSELDMVA